MDKSLVQTPENLKGLTSEEVLERRKKEGANKSVEASSTFLQVLRSALIEPMVLLLLIACTLYFIIGDLLEAVTMLAALIFVAGIDIFQNYRSQRAVKALTKITAAKAKVIRSGRTVEIPTEEIVTADLIICEQGMIVPADATIISSNDLALNEAILTGETFSVEKKAGDSILQGTLVVRGYCQAKVTSVGLHTVLSKIGELVKTAGRVKTPLQKRVDSFLKAMVLFGTTAFLFVSVYHFWESGSFIHGLLHGLTMAMSVLPEEIPVALSTFMALGAYRLYKAGVIARSPHTVEALGSATVICLDKTGTLTKNLMTVRYIFDFQENEEINLEKGGRASEALEYAMWASEEAPFDPMEKSIHQKYGQLAPVDERPRYKMIKEFPLEGSPPVMTHIFQSRNGHLKIASKGALEGILKLCRLPTEQKRAILEKGREYASKGLRVLGVAKGRWAGNALPDAQERFDFSFLGIITFYDPPESHIPGVIKDFYGAGVEVVMITGDYPETAMAIARQSGIKENKILIGEEVAQLSDEELSKAVTATSVFARINPEEKLRIIDALKQNGEIVAMTGDGVNDAPALKAAHIGIAMGRRGTEVAKEAAGLVLSGDNLSKMTDAIYLGRRINENLKKAFRYIISIHIPIILLVAVPIFMPWLPSMLFTPVHVIFLELIMGPTCSIIYENEPTPKDELAMPAGRRHSGLFTLPELSFTILQGLVITAGCILAGYYATTAGLAEPGVRSYVFGTLIFSNIFLTLVNRSFSTPIWRTLTMKNRLIPLILILSLVFFALINYLPILNQVFSLSRVGPEELGLMAGIAFLATIWVEAFKIGKGQG